MSYQDSEDFLRDKAQRLRQELLEVETELTERALLPLDQRLAEELHAKMCHHADMCGWFYNSWSSPGDRQRYLDKARDMLKFVDFDTAIKIVSLL